MIKYYLLVILSIVLSVASNFFLKKGATISGEKSILALINVNLIYGLSLLGFAFIAYYLSLSKININIVYPTITAFSVILITIMSYYIFKEPITPKHIISITIILFGIVFMFS